MSRGRVLIIRLFVFKIGYNCEFCLSFCRTLLFGAIYVFLLITTLCSQEQRCCCDLSYFFSVSVSPWYNRHGWLGVKNQLSIYLSVSVGWLDLILFVLFRLRVVSHCCHWFNLWLSHVHHGTRYAANLNTRYQCSCKITFCWLMKEKSFPLHKYVPRTVEKNPRPDSNYAIGAHRNEEPVVNPPPRW